LLARHSRSPCIRPPFSSPPDVPRNSDAL
jgi:hypothetical protein